MTGERGIDYSNCYYANFWAFKEMDKEEQKDYVLVHAVREMAHEYWGGHAFLLNKKTNKILDFSNGKRLEGTKEELFKQWNIQEDGLRMYYEYTYKESVMKCGKTRTYGAWDLLFEDWKNKEWGSYMENYFIPTFQPDLYQIRQTKKGVV